MKIEILAIGKKHQPNLAAAIEDYTNRLSRLGNVSWKLLDHAAIDTVRAVEIESERLLDQIQPQDFIILLDEAGQAKTSNQLAENLGKLQNQALKKLIVVIGGSYGVGPTVKTRADLILSLSELTLPHQLVRLILVEQLYRAFSIMHNRRYHHG